MDEPPEACSSCRGLVLLALANDPVSGLMDEVFLAFLTLIYPRTDDGRVAGSVAEEDETYHCLYQYRSDEAIKLGDRIAIMKDGEVVQVGTPEEILI